MCLDDCRWREYGSRSRESHACVQPHEPVSLVSERRVLVTPTVYVTVIPQFLVAHRREIFYVQPAICRRGGGAGKLSLFLPRFNTAAAGPPRHSPAAGGPGAYCCPHFLLRDMSATRRSRSKKPGTHIPGYMWIWC